MSRPETLKYLWEAKQYYDIIHDIKRSVNCSGIGELRDMLHIFYINLWLSFYGTIKFKSEMYTLVSQSIADNVLL